MLEVLVLQGALRALSAMFGGVGVFFVYLSFLKPALAVHAVLFLGAALGILRLTPQR